VAGANLSGDLKDPTSAIPKGTLLAVMTTYISYIVYATLTAGCAIRYASGIVEEYQFSEGLLNETTIELLNITKVFQISFKLRISENSYKKANNCRDIAIVPTEIASLDLFQVSK